MSIDLIRLLIDTLEKLAKSVKREPHPSDIELLSNMWRFINGKVIHDLHDGVLDQVMTSELMTPILQYLDYREHPENHLYDKKLEMLLKQFDEILIELVRYTRLLFFHDPDNRFRLKYNLDNPEASKGISNIDYKDFEQYKQKCERMFKVAIKLLNKHNELITLLRKKKILIQIARANSIS